MSELLFIPLIGILDSLRGNNWPIKGLGSLKKIILGFSISLGIGFTGLILFASTVLFAISFAPGWGTPLGAVLGRHNNMGPSFETWQVKFLRKNAFIALCARGLIAAVIVSPLVYWHKDILWLFLLLPICYSFPALATRDWENYELIRGCSIGLLCIIIRMG